MESNAPDTGAGAAKATPGCFICETALPLLEQCLGPATINHFRASRIEFLKGIRSLIDLRISQLSKATEQKGTHVTVE